MHQKVKELLLGENPCSIGKIGSIELIHFASAFLDKKPVFCGNSLAINAGINIKNLEEYEIWLNHFKFGIQNLDVVLAWNKTEQETKILDSLCPLSARTEEFPDIEPFSHGEDGWHFNLKDKKVLVVSSFKNSIEKQLPKYSKIWDGAEIGDCEIIESPQPFQITGNDPIFYEESIFELERKIMSKDFDICIVGAGGFSLPLCGIAKGIGKRAIHLGGATQVLFGIRGSRFDRNFADQPWYGTENFITPLESDIPKFHYMVEQGCYW